MRAETHFTRALFRVLSVTYSVHVFVLQMLDHFSSCVLLLANPKHYFDVKVIVGYTHLAYCVKLGKIACACFYVSKLFETVISYVYVLEYRLSCHQYQIYNFVLVVQFYDAVH